MRLRRLLLTATAIATLGTTALTPAAQATNLTGGPIAHIVVGGDDTNTSHPVSLTMTTGSINFNFYGRPFKASCYSGSASGHVNGGAIGTSPLPGMALDSISMNCDGFSISSSSTCSHENVDFWDSKVHPGLVDVGVPGTSDFSAVNGALKMTDSSGTDCGTGRLQIAGLICSFPVGGTPGVQFDEAITNNGDQHLRLSGNPTIHNVSGCLGAVSNNQTFTLTADFSVASTDGWIDFAPAVAPVHTPRVLVNGSDAAADHDLDAVVTSASATIDVYGIPMNLACTSGTADGTTHGGAPGTDAAVALDQLSLACPSIFPGTTATMTLDQCDVDVVMDDASVHQGLDPAVDGVAHLTSRTDPTQHCLRVNISNGCQFRIGGYVAAEFHEAIQTIGGTDYQTLQLAGTGLQVKGATNCLGAIANNNTPITIAAAIDVHSPDGPIDFVPAP